jgi:hypothetical protein
MYRTPTFWHLAEAEDFVLFHIFFAPVAAKATDDYTVIMEHDGLFDGIPAGMDKRRGIQPGEETS